LASFKAFCFLSWFFLWTPNRNYQGIPNLSIEEAEKLSLSQFFIWMVHEHSK
jgi:hypothetical protein